MFGRSGFFEQWGINGERGTGPLELLLVVVFLSCYPSYAPASQYSAPPLLLSFNLTYPKDITTIEKLQLQHRATYFTSPQVYKTYPDRIREIIADSSVGLLFTPSGQRDSGAVLNNLSTSRQELAAIIGREAVWFRSTSRTSLARTLLLAEEAGFRYDSSESDRRLVQDILPEFPFATPDEKGAGQALERLKDQYLKCADTARPFIVQFDASTIGKQEETLHGLIDFVLYHGGRLLSFDDYLHHLSARQTKYKGLYIDLGRGDPQPEKLVKAVQHGGITDVFLMAQNGTGKKFYATTDSDTKAGSSTFVGLIKLLRAEGIRVHAWLAVNRNDRIAAKHPGLAMVDWNGKKSTHWISPAHPNNVDLKLTIHELVVNYDIDGIHLDHLNFPDLAFDFSDHAISSFERFSGKRVPPDSRKDITKAKYFSQWSEWRYLLIRSLIGDAASTIAGFSKRKLVLSVAVQGSAIIDHTQMVATGQDLSLFAGDLDLVIIKLDSVGMSEKGVWGDRLAITSSLLAGNRPLLLGRSDTVSLSGGKFQTAQFDAVQQWGLGTATAYATREETRLPERREVGDALAPLAPSTRTTGELTESTAAKNTDTSLSMARFWLIGVGFILLMMLTTLRNIRIRRARKEENKESLEVAEKTCEIMMPEFIAGFIYAVKSEYHNTAAGADARTKLAIILTSGADAMMLYIHSDRKTGTSMDSQIPVTPSEIPRLPANAYIDTSCPINAGEAVVKVETIVGVVPEPLKSAIRVQIENNPSLSKEKQDQIVREFR